MNTCDCLLKRLDEKENELIKIKRMNTELRYENALAKKSLYISFIISVFGVSCLVLRLFL